MNRSHKLLLFVLLLVLPVQGIAAAFAPLHKAAAQSGAMPCHDAGSMPQTAAHGEAPAAPHDGHQSPDGDSANHLCCHQVFSAVSLSLPATPAQKFSDVPRFVLPLATLFIPDSPDRPPRG